MTGTTTQRFSQQQLESYLWGAATLLRGTIDAGDYKQFIFPLLFYKRLCDVFDEERIQAKLDHGKDFPEDHRFQIPSKAHWNKVREVTTNVGHALQSAMRSIEEANKGTLYGIFGDAQWTNKDRLPDAMLRDLIEHFSTLDLTIANLPEDELGNGYEYLIKKFADDSGHTAAEFYTNRTVVHLMTELLQPQPGESIYDPTCGSGGMLLSAIAHLKNQGKEWRNVKLYGQELNLMTSSIARMNCFLHGVEDFRIERGNTLSNPKFIEKGKLQKFDVILANPPYSIKQWDRAAFENDPWGRNQYGTPPQGCADYAFQQHINKSLNPKTGRCAILWPHGILFRRAERDIRRKMIEDDLIECVIGLGKNLFYNSAMEACILICRTDKPTARRGKILLIDAVDEVTHERGQSFLTDAHIQRIAHAYHGFSEEAGFAKVITNEDAMSHDGSLAIPLYVESSDGPRSADETLLELRETLAEWSDASQQLRGALAEVLPDVADSLPELGEVQEPDWLDRSSWKRVKLGEVVVRTAKKVEMDPDNVQRWVGADHMDEGDIHIRRWGTTDDPLFPPTFRHTFQDGAIMLHSRNPNKVCIAQFDGITGEKIFVLRSSDETQMLTKYLGWVMKSDEFRSWVATRLSGSVNKFLNWRALADWEIVLPPLEVQKRLLRVAFHLDNLVEAHGDVARLLGVLLHSSRHDAFGKATSPSNPLLDATDEPLGNRYEIQLGKMLSKSNSVRGAPRPYLRNANVLWGEFDLSDVAEMGFTDEEATKFSLRPGDILACEGRHVGRSAMWGSEIAGACYQKALHRIRPLREADVPRYLLHHMAYYGTTGEFLRNVRGTTIPHLPAERLRAMNFRFYPTQVQRDIATHLDKIENAAKSCGALVQKDRQTMHRFLNALFIGGQSK